MFVGCHVSIRHGYVGAAKAAHSVGARAFQYFPKNPRNLSVKAFDQRDAAACREYSREHRLLSIAHTPYPTNLSVDNADLYKATVKSVQNDLEIAEACGSIGVVVHFGQYKGDSADPLHGYQVMIRMLNDVLAGWEGEALLLLENNAGQGGRMGTTLEELTQVRSLLASPEQVGFCLDTCHAFASGIWKGEGWEEVAEKARALQYFAHLKAVHLNDSVYPSGSFRDRHANIGRGRIGEKSILSVLRTPEMAKLPIVLETPNASDGTHRAEIDYLNRLLAD